MPYAGHLAGYYQPPVVDLALDAAFLDEGGDVVAAELASRPGRQYPQAARLLDAQPGRDLAALYLR